MTPCIAIRPSAMPHRLSSLAGSGNHATDGPGGRENARGRDDRPRQSVRAVEFYNARRRGCTSRDRLRSVRFRRDWWSRSDTDRYNHLVLLCRNQEGYRNLIQLDLTAFLEGFYYKPRIDKDLLAQHSKGLIALSACLRGDINGNAAPPGARPKRLAYTYSTCSARGIFSWRFRITGPQDKIVCFRRSSVVAGDARIPCCHERLALYVPERARAHETCAIQTRRP